jgi:hypothetical protein
MRRGEPPQGRGCGAHERQGGPAVTCRACQWTPAAHDECSAPRERRRQLGFLTFAVASVVLTSASGRRYGIVIHSPNSGSEVISCKQTIWKSVGARFELLLLDLVLFVDFDCSNLLINRNWSRKPTRWSLSCQWRSTVLHYSLQTLLWRIFVAGNQSCSTVCGD